MHSPKGPAAPDGGPLDLTQAKKLFDFRHRHEVEIDAIEFMNEPNMMELSGAPKDYTSADYARDQDILYGCVRVNYPNCLLVGPCANPLALPASCTFLVL